MRGAPRGAREVAGTRREIIEGRKIEKEEDGDAGLASVHTTGERPVESWPGYTVPLPVGVFKVQVVFDFRFCAYMLRISRLMCANLEPGQYSSANIWIWLILRRTPSTSRCVVLSFLLAG